MLGSLVPVKIQRRRIVILALYNADFSFSRDPLSFSTGKEVSTEFRMVINNCGQTRICASLGLHMKFKTLFMSDEEKYGHNFDLPLFFNICMQFLAPRGSSAECVQVSVM